MTVTVYSKPSCPQCDATIRTLDRLKLDHPDLEYVKVDALTPNAIDAIRSRGYSSVPVVVAGDEHWSGFRPDRLAALVA